VFAADAQLDLGARRATPLGGDLDQAADAVLQQASA
jgi:hypothetical protein